MPTVSATVKQKISGKTCTVQVTVIVTAVGTAAGQILVPLPTAASYAVAGAAVDLSNGGINMTCVVNGAQMQIVPTAGVISNDVYLGFATYEIA